MSECFDCRYVCVPYSCVVPGAYGGKKGGEESGVSQNVSYFIILTFKTIASTRLVKTNFKIETLV